MRRRRAAVFLSESVGGLEPFISEGFKKLRSRPEFKWVRGPAYRWLHTPPDTAFARSEAALPSL